jgi:hypothetical protein
VTERRTTERLRDLAAAAGADPARERIALVLGAAGAVLAALAIEPPLGGFALDEPFAAPPLFLGAVLALAALAGVAAARVGGGGGAPAVAAGAAQSRAAYLLAALALAALAALAAVGAAERLEDRAGGLVPAATVALAAVVLASGLAARRAPLAAAGALLAAAGASGFVEEPSGGIVGWLLAAAGALLAFIALATAVHDARPATAPFGEAARAAAAAIDLRLTAALLFAGVAALTVAGALYDVDAITIGTFDLNAEQTVGVVYSSFLLLLAALVAWLLATADRDKRTTWLTLAIVFGVLSLDELVVFHEELQERTDVKGQLFLAPLAIAGAVAWLNAIRDDGRDPLAARLLVGGAIGWALSQAFDLLQDPEENEWMWTVVPEEAAEMAGSALFALGLLAALKAITPP